MHRLEGAGQFQLEGVRPTYIEQLRVPHLSVGTYSIPAETPDPQGPHTEDEIYLVVRGAGTLWTPTNTVPVAPGDVLFVPAGELHRFEDITDDLCVLVVFGPAEYSLGTQDARRPGEAGTSEEAP